MGSPKNLTQLCVAFVLAIHTPSCYAVKNTRNNSSPYASLSGKGFFSRSVKSQPSNKCCRKS